LKFPHLKPHSTPTKNHQVGPEGAGKATFLRHCIARLRGGGGNGGGGNGGGGGGAVVAEVHCSAATGAAHVLDKLVQVGWIPFLTGFLAAVLTVVGCRSTCISHHHLNRPSKVCGKPVTTATGRVLRPEMGRVILLLRDINLPRCGAV
jgi:hypothetical protein